MAGLGALNYILIAILVPLAYLGTVLVTRYVLKRRRSRATKKAEALKAEEERQQRAVTSAGFGDMRELMLQTESEDVRLERMKAYIERPAQRLLRGLLDKGNGAEIIPIYDPTAGFRYKEAEAAFDSDISTLETEKFLERLHSLDILSKVFFDTISACPVCSANTLTLHYHCSKCGSHHVVKTSLTEHIPCGYIGEKEDFYKKGPAPICPKCSVLISEKDTRDMGLWYTCRNCKEKFEAPQHDLACRKCGKEFPLRSANIREVSKFSLNPEKEQEIRQNVTSLEVIEELLTEQGFKVETAATAIGERSGIQHNFSLLATKEIDEQKRFIAVDHAVANTEVGASPLILFTFKISEVKVDLPVFIAIPRLSQMAKRIAQGYHVIVIEGIPKQKEELTTLYDEISKKFGEKPTIETGPATETKTEPAEKA